MGCGASAGKSWQVRDGKSNAPEQTLTTVSPAFGSLEDPVEDFVDSGVVEMTNYRSISSERSEPAGTYTMKRSRSSQSRGLTGRASPGPLGGDGPDETKVVYLSHNVYHSEDHSARVEVVQEVYIFRHLAPHQLDLVAESIVEREFGTGDHVITQGELGTSFFVVRGGEVEVFIDWRKIRNMGVNAYFGERALLFDEPRTATVRATGPVQAWEIEKSTFLSILSSKMKQQLLHRIELQDTNVKLEDLVTLKQIGTGAYGLVELVEHKKTKTWYALKKVKKVDGATPSEVTREMNLLAMNDHPFVMHLVKTFECELFAYMLTELIAGGEMHAAIRRIDGCFTTQQAQFYIGSLLLGVEALHLRSIVFRDLKPENVMLDGQGYLKIIDFGIAKKLETAKTYTIIGTAHYMAPEVMKGKGYGLLVDIWALGIMLFELVCGYLPFGNDSEDNLEIAKLILKGKMNFPDFYKYAAGKDVMERLCCTQVKKRLGAGSDGYEEIRSAQFFAISNAVGGDLFDQLMARELDPPVLPYNNLSQEHTNRQAARSTKKSGSDPPKYNSTGKRSKSSGSLPSDVG